MKLSDTDMGIILTALGGHVRSLTGATGPGPARERAQTRRLLAVFEKLDEKALKARHGYTRTKAQNRLRRR